MIHQILEKFSVYYQLLKEADKERFQIRVQDFLKGRQFISRLDGEIPEEIKVLVASVAIQITFGLKKYMLPHFNTIIIYPEKYFSHINKRYHKGEVNLGGAIVISLHDFLEGWKNPFDSYNLGIHEFAHAVFFENFIKNEDFLFIDQKLLDKWFTLAGKKISQQRVKDSFIREYAFNNKQEFFAVCTEYFFERPDELEKEFPELYRLMCKIFNQDTKKMYGELLKFNQNH